MSSSNFFRRAKVNFVLVVVGGFLLTCVYNACSPVEFAKDLSTEKVEFQSAAAIVIDGDAAYTNHSEHKVRLSLKSEKADEVYVTNDSTCASGGAWEPMPQDPAQTREWVLASANSRAKVFAKFRSKALQGQETPCVSDDILHDDQPPGIEYSKNAPKLIGLAQKGKELKVGFDAKDEHPSDPSGEVSGLDSNVTLCLRAGSSDTLCPKNESAINVTIGSEGFSTVRVRAADLAGNTNEAAFAIEADFTAPAVLVNSGPQGRVNVPTAQFTYSATDNRAGSISYECKFTKAAEHAAATFKSCVTSYPTPDQGPYKFSVVAIDEAGNRSTVAERELTIDRTAPTVLITKFPPPYSSQANETIEYRSADSAKPLVSVDCRLDGVILSATRCTVGSAILESLADGDHKFEVRGRDDLQNQSDWASVNWKTDRTKPSGLITSGPTPRTNLRQAVLTYQFTDVTAGIDPSSIRCALRRPGEALPALGVCPATSQSYSLTTEGAYSFQVQASDRAGNVSDLISYSFTLDTKAPTLDVTGPAPSNNPSVTVVIVASDDSGIAPVKRCAINKTNPAQGDYTVCPSDGKFTLPPGSNTITVIAVDDVGNTSPPKVVTVVVDTNPPVITFGPIPADQTDGRLPARVTFTVTDDMGLGPVTCTYRDVTTAQLVNVPNCFTRSSDGKSGTGVISIQNPGVGDQLIAVAANDQVGNGSTGQRGWKTAKVYEVGSSANQATVVFEDSAPSVGDQDYNEGVADFNITEAYNGNDELTKVTIDFLPVASGAGDYKNALSMSVNGLAPPHALAGIADRATLPLVEGMSASDTVTVTRLRLDGTVIEARNVRFDNAVQLIDFTDAFRNADGSENTQVNSKANEPNGWRRPNFRVRLEVQVKTPSANLASARLKNNAVDLARYRFNLNVLRNNGQRFDVDLVDVVSTAYDANGQPWGFIVPQNWKYPREDSKIVAAYPRFPSYVNCLRSNRTNAAQCTPENLQWFKFPGSSQHIFPRELLPK